MNRPILSREARLRAVVHYPHAGLEWWLQLYFHTVMRRVVLPRDAVLVAFEETPHGDGHTQSGVCDLVYRDSSGQLYVIETKIIDERSGATARKRRTRKRDHLWCQLERRGESFAHRGVGTPILIAVTTDWIDSPMPGAHCRVACRKLLAWRSRLSLSGALAGVPPHSR